MIATVHIMECSIEFRSVGHRHVILKHDSVSETRRLIVLIDIDGSTFLHLVGWQEVDCLFYISWEETLLEGHRQLVKRRDATNGISFNIRVIHLSVSCIKTVVEVTEEEVVISNDVCFEAWNTVLELLHLELIDELAGHKVASDLVLTLVLQMRTDNVEEAVFE